MSDITREHATCDAARARELLKEAVAVELFIADTASREGTSIRAVMADGERVPMTVQTIVYVARSRAAPYGRLVLRLTDDTEIVWSRPVATGDGEFPDPPIGSAS